jgi:hypothetical protein
MMLQRLLLIAALGVWVAGCMPEAPSSGRPGLQMPDAGRFLVTPDGGVPLPTPPPTPQSDGAPPVKPPPPPPPPPPGNLCGNGTLDPGETCDSDMKSCATLDKAYNSGTAPCNASCTGYGLTGCVKAPPVQSLADALKTITETQLKKDLDYIASDALAGRFPGRTGDQQARTYIENAFKSAGLSPAKGQSGFQQAFTWSSKSTANVVGVLPGTDANLKDQVIIVGGHHDHLGTSSDYGCSSKGGNSICNGADDNGTGTVAVMAVARAMAKLKGQNRRTLVFMLFGAEEKGLVGSKYYVNTSPLYPLSKTVYMINLDMIGDATGSVKALGASRSSLAKGWITSAAQASGISASSTSSAGGGSDHYHFATNSVPYVFFHTGISACYHATCDTVEKIHYSDFTKITKLVARFMWKLSQDDSNPRSDFVSYTNLPPKSYVDWKYFSDHLDHGGVPIN